MNINRKILIGSIAAALAATSAYAQPQGAEAGRGGGHHGMHGSHHGGNSLSPAARVEGRLAALRVELKITPNQESAWKTFADRSRKQAEGMPARHEEMRSQMKADLPAPERLAQHTAFAKQRVASMENMTAAVTDLYAVLTPEQKKTADQLLARGPRDGDGHGNRGGHGGRGEHGGRGMRS
jgi:Spy/CpxP family protein refolding chaperone